MKGAIILIIKFYIYRVSVITLGLLIVVKRKVDDFVGDKFMIYLMRATIIRAIVLVNDYGVPNILHNKI